MKRVLISGGAGFIGSHLCERLLGEGNDVICIDNYFTGHKSNIRHLLNPERFVFVGGVISDPWFFEQLQRTVEELSRAVGERWDAVLQVSELGIEHAGLLGAASVAFYNMKLNEQNHKEV